MVVESADGGAGSGSAGQGDPGQRRRRGRATDGAAVGSFAQHRRGLAAALPQRGTRWPAHQGTAGRPQSISPAKERAVISATLRKPKAATHWSARRLAKGLGLSAATVHRIWQKYGL
jgi:hypothetical protein